jgi:hypothetical protein
VSNKKYILDYNYFVILLFIVLQEGLSEREEKNGGCHLKKLVMTDDVIAQKWMTS